MATSSNVPVNGAKVVEETKTTGAAVTTSSQKSKQESIPKTNGHTQPNGKSGVNGSSEDSANGSPPPPTEPSFEGPAAYESLSLEEQHSNHSQDDPELKRDLYVGNLNPHVTTQMLKDLFGGDATVENVKIVPDRMNTHGGFGYGFVTMKTREDAEKYLSQLHGFNYMAAELRVNWATPTKSAEQGLSVFIGDIGPDVTKEDLTEAFKDPESRITDTRIVMDPVSGRTKGYGFVSYTDGAAAARALSKNGEILKGRRIRVNWANTGKEAKMMPGQPFMYPPELYGQPVAPMPRPDVTNILLALAQVERLDVGWYMALSLEIQAGIVRVSQEAPNAKVMWVGNLDKNTTQIDLAAQFAQYGFIEEMTMVSPQGYAFVAMASHLMAATLIVLFKDFTIRGRKLKTGWSHSTQRQLQQQAAATSLQQPHPATMMPPHPHHRPQPSMGMQAPPPQMQMSPIPMAPQPGYIAYQPQMMYPYVQPVPSYPLVHHPNGTPTGTSTPRSATSENAAPSAPDAQIQETPSAR